ncbi:hypothetical protein EN852_014885 [Mesorhizobium sp. M2E.F.Ca.ET.209.01.1.1]|uniref:hypothetical protein n=1 Tax=Mesorhizobium sp. M2E.F.Ca.ET.209.01.1.1 TaxID=2500526 RepID=UPI000FDAEDD8|nr:hypothetical protein [Mesorhizobium sp. M2E.F.Ca.ET.209.01.1.1]TGS13735.1 hypothetical protein EN852_014885 [Mesorhizobium sp. M2E.F.Ca.ET.209.01.1.1]
MIGIDSLDADQEKQFRDYIGPKGAWWHWIENLWLLTTKKDNVSAKEIRDKVRAINPTARVVVFEFPEDITWAASSSTNASGKKLADWLNTPWGDP